MIKYLTVSLIAGFLFVLMDGLINSNPEAKQLFLIYQSIARTNPNVMAGIAIDVIYGFIMAAIFMILYQSLPGMNGFLKGLSFGVLAWFFRVLMYVVSQSMIINIQQSTMIYILCTGLLEMMVLGIFYGLTLSVEIPDKRR
jgi:hypothetical protein